MLFTNRRLIWICILLFAISAMVVGQTQSPQEAGIEVFFAKNQSEVEKHLLTSTKDALRQVPPEIRDRFLNSLMGAERGRKDGMTVTRLTGENQFVQIEDPNRPIRVVVSKGAEKIENGNATLEYSALMPDGKTIPAVVRLKQENGVWCLVGASVDGRNVIPELDQPNLASALMESSMQGNEASAVGSLRTIVTANLTYSNSYKGYAPNLGSMAGSGNGAESAEHANLIDSTLGCAKQPCIRKGYKISYTRTSENSYFVIARPAEYGASGKRSFYTDQSGIIRFITENRDPVATDPPIR